MMMSHLLALFVALLVEKPAMKLQKLYLESGANKGPGTGVADSVVGKDGTKVAAPPAAAAKKERPRVFENPTAKYMH